jgi:hypothetical protein
MEYDRVVSMLEYIKKHIEEGKKWKKKKK